MRAFYTELDQSCMIKHDYKPQTGQKKLNPFKRGQIPAWMTHPYLILGMAISVMALAWLLSLPEPRDEVEIHQVPLLSLEQAKQEVQQEVVEAQQQAVLQGDSGNDLIDNNLIDNDLLDVEQGTAIDDDSLYSAPIEIPLVFEKLADDQAKLPSIDDSKWQVESVKKGDNLSKIFKRIGLSPQQLYKVVNLDDNTKPLKNLRPGEALSYQIDENKQLIALKYTKNIEETLYIENINGQLSSRLEKKVVEIRTNFIHGVINDSLFTDGLKVELTDSQIINFANIFDWDIDFSLDIRKGDSFSVLFEEKYLEGEKIGNGDIIAAEFVNQGKPFVALQYTDTKNSTSYYTPDGNSMRKAFLRAPLSFKYISSSFNPKRFHPILKRVKAHRGIDYRAKTGTPIRAAGDGKVIESSSNRYNGKYIFIQHGQGIVTKYLHMSRRAVSRGKRVKQGQIIGYVGSTGMSQAPHLHYEFLVNGVHRNPRTVTLPKAKPIVASEKARFLSKTAPWLKQLNARNALINRTAAVSEQP
jgi:murein DD-endopeptidase MepM/ murein hydrolase activator NlpD